MAVPVTLPELGAGEDATVRVSSWLVDPGDRIETGDRVVEVLVQGITFNVSAPAPGVLKEIEKPLDTPVHTGDVLGWIEPADVEGSRPG